MAARTAAALGALSRGILRAVGEELDSLDVNSFGARCELDYRLLFLINVKTIRADNAMSTIFHIILPKAIL